MAYAFRATPGVCLVLLLALPAQAQTPAPAPTADTTVTVTAKKKPVERKIEGTVYDQSKNLQAQSGTVADVLNTVPAVRVSPDGNVTLRGNADVQVYINGKPAAQMQGDSRAVTLQSMSGSDIASVEVITNPSAKYGANGSGIINIVLKKNRKPGGNGTLNVNNGNGQRYNASLSGNYTHGRLSLHGMAGVRRDMRRGRQSSDLTWIDPINGPTGRSMQHSAGKAYRASQSANAGLDYDLTDNDTLSLSATYARRHSANQNDEFHQDLDAHGVLNDDYDRRSVGPRGQTDTGLTGIFDHHGKTGGEVKLQLTHSQTTSTQDKSYRNIFSVPTAPDAIERVLFTLTRRIDEFSGDYVRPVGETAQLSMGFDVQATQDGFYNYNAQVDTVTGAETVKANTTNRFVVDQAINAAYVTFQTPVGKWTVLSGLRLEQATATAHQITTGVTHAHTFVSLSPSLHATYDIDAARQLTASFSQSLQRPSPQDLNPFTVYGDAQNVYAGNPDLKPQHIGSVELGYSYTSAPLSDSTTLYYRTSANTVTAYSAFIGNNVLLTTKRNSGSGRSGGVDYNLNAKPSETLSYSFDINVFYAELQAADGGGWLRQSDVSYTVQASLDYAPNETDGFELSGNAQGRSLTSQGTRSGVSSVNLSWRHRLTPKLRLVVNAFDLFNGGRQESVTRTSTVHQVAYTHDLGPTVFVGLSWVLSKKQGSN